MTHSTGKHMLPLLPHPHHLRKQAKARLAQMKTHVAAARLADAQFVLAREYGFATWAALQAEVAHRAAGPLGQRARIKRTYGAAPYPERFRQDGLLDQETEIETQLAFFWAGVVTQIGFVLVALTGVSLLFLTAPQLRAAHAAFARLAQHIL